MGTRWWNEDDNTTLAQFHAEGKSLSWIAKEMERSTRTISVYSKDLGLTWPNPTLIKATLAHVSEAKARRARLELGFLEDAERLRQQLFAPALLGNFGGRDNTWNETHLDQPVFADQLKITQAATISLAHSIRIAEHDSDAGLDTAIGMLDRVAAAVDVAVTELDDLI